MKETETPEAIHRRLLSEKGFDPADPEFYDIDINYLEAYHQERMKSILPSEQEINKKLQAINKLMFDYQYKTSFNTVFDNISEEIDELIELLTKGDI